MAIGKETDFKIYQEEFFGGMSEALEQNSNLFNASSNGAIRLFSNRMKGYYSKESFVKELTTLISRRDTTSVAAATDQPLVQGEQVSVKINRKIGPVGQTLDSFRKIARDPSEMSFILGQQIGQAVSIDYINTTLNALDAALSGVAALNYDASALPTGGAGNLGTRRKLEHTSMVRAMAKFGDASSKIVAWVMHSKPFFDLMEVSIADKIFNVANVTIYEGSIATFGKPVIVTDSTGLINGAGSALDYTVLGLVEDAATVEESEEREIVSDTITGLENLVVRIQGEYAYNLKIKGFTWDVTNGGANPTDSAIATQTNWDQVATDNKNLAGVRLIVE